MKKDEFKLFEDKIVKFVGNHKGFIYVVLLILCLWLVFSITVTTISGYVGAANADVKMREFHDKGTVTDESYNMWENVLIPVVTMVFETMKWFGLSIGALFLTLSIYFGIRSAYKYKRENL